MITADACYFNNSQTQKTLILPYLAAKELIASSQRHYKKNTLKTISADTGYVLIKTENHGKQ